MKEQLIGIEVATLAKEKGFDERCSFFHGSWEDYEGIHHMDNCNRHNTSKQFSAPTQGLLQKWLREKYNIEVIPQPTCSQLDFKFGYNYYIWNKTNGYEFWSDPENTVAGEYTHNTYEEALEQGLMEGLKLI